MSANESKRRMLWIATSVLLVAIGAGFCIFEQLASDGVAGISIAFILAPVWVVIAVVNIRSAKVMWWKRALTLLFGVPLVWFAARTGFVILLWSKNGFAP